MASTSWWTKETIAVVTGSYKGIGFEIVKQLAQKGLTVVLTARDARKGLEATQKLKNEGLNVVFHTLDVLSTVSVSQLANWLKQEYNGLDILFNNAAIIDYEPSFTAAQSVLETNYEAVKRTTQQLLPLLRSSSAGARIINISSVLGQLVVIIIPKEGPFAWLAVNILFVLWLGFLHLQKLKDPALREEMGNLENLTEEKVDKFVEKYLQDMKEQRLDGSGWPYRAYSVSKIALNAYSRVLAKSLKDRPEGQHIYVNCATPGFCKTDLTRNAGIYTAEQGAETPVWVALLPPNGLTGQFFSQKNIEQF